MLKILATDYMKEGKGIGQVLEFAGDGIKDWPIDERATLTNMAVEAGGFTGIIEPDEVTLEYLTRIRGLDADEVRKGFLRSDEDAEDRKSTRLNSSHVSISYAVFCLKKKKKIEYPTTNIKIN